MRTPTSARRFLAAALCLAVVAVLVAGLALRLTTATSPAGPAAPAGPAKTVDGLLIMTVSQALAAEPSSGDGLVAVEGWYTPMPIHSCPAPMPSAAAFEYSCPYEILVTENRQDLVTIWTASDTSGWDVAPPTAPYLFAREAAGNSIRTLLPDRDVSRPDTFRPIPAVLVGHFHDARAAECSADGRAACESAFIVDRLARLDGQAFSASVWIGTDANGASLQPRLTSDGVAAALRPSLDPADTIVSMAAANLVDMTTVTGKGLQASGPGTDILWFVRVAGPASKSPLMAWGTARDGWFVLDDATGKVRGVGGWGYVSAASGSFPPSPRPSLTGGLFALPTTNWLAGGICAGVGLVDAFLHGSLADPHLAWLEGNFVPSSRREVIWPAGYRARFNPNLEVLDETGNVVLRDGDAVRGACNTSGNTFYLEPPFA
jgi:hypothetical protein